MAAAKDELKTDLAMTTFTGVANAVPLHAADSWGSLDLAVVAGGRGGLVRGNVLDLKQVSGRENLAQALILRLLTPRGSLAPLGHASYGSRLVELIGRLNDQTTRHLARLYTLQALGEERRVVRTRDLTVGSFPDRPDVIRISFSVQPLDGGEPLALALEVAL